MSAPLVRAGIGRPSRPRAAAEPFAGFSHKDDRGLALMAVRRVIERRIIDRRDCAAALNLARVDTEHDTLRQ
jgi:hypothetical protein